MELLIPPRIENLGSFSINVVFHTKESLTTQTIEKVYPFESLLSLKQKILILAKNDWHYLPNNQFIAVEIKRDAYLPLEFGYDEVDSYADPLKTFETDSKFVDSYGVKKTTTLHIFDGRTVSSVLNDDDTVHVWSLAECASLADPNKAIYYYGYFAKYFPKIRQPSEILSLLKQPTEDDKLAIEAVLQFQDRSMKNYSLIDERIKELPEDKNELVELFEFRAQLPDYTKVNETSLEAVFQELKLNKDIPMVRYFSKLGKSKPLVRLATGPSGIPLILDKNELRILFTDLPENYEQATIMIQRPIKSSDAPKGTTWRIFIYEDSTTILELKAPRADKLLRSVVLQKAFEMLPDIVKYLDYSTSILSNLTLTKCSAKYRMEGMGTIRPKYEEFHKRLTQYIPILFEERIPNRAYDFAFRLRIQTDNEDIEGFSHIQNAISIYNLNKHTTIQEIKKYLEYEYGLGPKESAFEYEKWARNYQQLFENPDEAIVLKYFGATIKMKNDHPKYIFDINNIENVNDLQILLTLLNVFLLNESPKIIDLDIPIATIESEVSEADVDEIDEDLLALLEMNGINSNNTKKDYFEVKEEHTTPTPTSIDQKLFGKEDILRLEDEPYIYKLISTDDSLFKWTTSKELKEKTYSRKCQHAQNRQPNVMTPEKYKYIRDVLYPNQVHWIEIPLTPRHAQAIEFCSKSPAERAKDKRDKKEKLDLEILGLKLGIKLKQSASFLGPKAPKIVTDLIESAESKELWMVARAGTRKVPNYYICSELWCFYDDYPILKSEFESPYLRSGEKKYNVPGCPFCGGGMIYKNEKGHYDPKPGQTVIERQDGHYYAGYFKDTIHPDKYTLPCCFKSVDSVFIPEDAIPIPSPAVSIPKHQLTLMETEAELAKVDSKAKSSSAESTQIDLTKSFRNLLKQSTYIIDESAKEMSAGSYALLPKQIDKLWGQTLDDYMVEKKGHLGLGPKTKAFFRFGLQLSRTSPGKNFLQFIGYIIYTCAQISPNISYIPSLKIMNPAEVLHYLFETPVQIIFARAFESANYGSLLYEFAKPDDPAPGSIGSLYSTEEFKFWCKKMGIEDEKYYEYAVRFFKAWRNFEEYVRDYSAPKDLRLWDSLFFTPGLFNYSGVLIPRFVYENEEAEIQCPPLGVPYVTQFIQKQIIIPVIYNERDNYIQPIVLLESPGILFGAFHPQSVHLNKLSKINHEKIRQFYAQYVKPYAGCSRTQNPIHLYTPYGRVPLLYDVYLFLHESKLFEPVAIQRDITNHIVGLVGQVKGDDTKQFYLPTVDDGYIITDLPSNYGYENFPLPQLNVILTILSGSDGESGISEDFDDYKVKQLRIETGEKSMIVAIELDGDSLIPIQPIPLLSSVPHPLFKKLHSTPIDSFPWELDYNILREGSEEDLEYQKDVVVNPKDIYNETYQHLRLSLSKWLQTPGAGSKTHKQISLLRDANYRLPLFELRKRLVILLEPIVSGWLASNGKDVKPSLLRKDCITMAEKDCTGLCSFDSGKCKIHYDKDFVSQPIKNLIFKLTDELLRYNKPAIEILSNKVPILRLPEGILKQKDSIIFKLEGRGDDDLFSHLGLSDRLTSYYSHGLVYPEELSSIDIGQAPESDIPAEWEKLGFMLPDTSDIISYNPHKVRNDSLLFMLNELNLTLDSFLKQMELSSFNWTIKQIEQASKVLKATFIFTRKNEYDELEYDKLFGTNNETYIILNNIIIPLIYKQKSGDFTYFVTLDQLPLSIQDAVKIRNFDD